jgi:hypothetical protein
METKNRQFFGWRFWLGSFATAGYVLSTAKGVRWKNQKK